MFLADAAIALHLIALTGGALLLIKSHQEGLTCRKCIKAISYFVIMVSILSLLCTAWNIFTNRSEKLVGLERQSSQQAAAQARMQNNAFNQGDTTNQIVLQRNRIARQNEAAAKENKN